MRPFFDIGAFSISRLLRDFALGAMLFMPLLCWAEACERNFERFLGRFESDRAFQERHIVYPLAYGSISACEEYPDCLFVFYTKSARQVTSQVQPLFPLRSYQQEFKLQRTVRIAGNSATVNVVIPEFDANALSFSFSLRGSCWRLTKVEDHNF